VTPLKPAAPGEAPRPFPDIPRERLTVDLPTLVLWAVDDIALLPGLLDGLDDYVPNMILKKVPGATHWIVHEQPERVAGEIEAFARGADASQ
jgi:pimeloyl-ACP methyl ester carboxylesterase